MPLERATTRAGAIALICLVLTACAGDQATEDDADTDMVAAVVPPKPRIPEPSLIGRFACDGSILHPSIDSKIESPAEFWFEVDSQYQVAGRLTAVGSPLNMTGGDFSGRLTPNFDNRGALTGGRMVVAWPNVRDNAPAEFQMMRETFVRAGQTINGVGQVIRRTSKHTYLSAKIWLDPNSVPTASGFRRATFVTATCFPEIDLPPAIAPQS